MGFAWKKSESLERGLRRIAGEQIAASIATIEERRLPFDSSVHDLRKRCKKLRGLLRLLRPALDKKLYSRENAAFRDLARSFSGSREAFIQLQTFDRLAKSLAANRQADCSRTSLAYVRDELAQTSPSDFAAVDGDHGLTEVLAVLRSAQSRARKWSLRDNREDVLEAGLRKTQDRGRRALKRARKKSTAKRLHDWRKRVKDGGYHMRLLRELWPNASKPRQRRFEELGELLGTDHDLAELCAALEPMASGEHSACVRAVIELAQDERNCLQRKALELGELLYSQPRSPRNWSG